MILVDNIGVSNFENAMRGMRNPKNSWDKNDTVEDLLHLDCIDFDNSDEVSHILKVDNDLCSLVTIGPNDLKLAQTLIKGGPVHSKFLRQIFVSMDIDAPLYWWKEADTYKVSTVANSCSTMHKITSAPITRDCFSFDRDSYKLCLDLNEEWGKQTDVDYLGFYFDQTIYNCEQLRKLYLETKDIKYWRALIQLLPSSWNQKRTWTANYEILRNIKISRANHKLEEWLLFCQYIDMLPYADELINFGL